jgi:predicted nucleic acid-binding protein
LSDEECKNFLQDLESRSEFISISYKTNACRDSKDNKFLELAVSGKATYIVSGDKDLQDLGKYQGIEILSPSQFLERERQRGPAQL